MWPTVSHPFTFHISSCAGGTLPAFNSHVPSGGMLCTFSARAVRRFSTSSARHTRKFDVVMGSRHTVLGMDFDCRQDLISGEKIGSSVKGDPVVGEKNLEFSKRIQKRGAHGSLTANLGVKRQNLKLNEDIAAINGITEEDERFMGEALVEAKKAAMAGEVPVGAIVVQKGKIIARAYNRVESDADPTAHAEMLCLRSAARHIGDWRLMDATLYVTLEPCPMCAGAILQSRMKGLVWGSRNTLLGADGSWVSLFPELDEEGTHLESQKSEDELCPRPFIHPFHTSLEVRRQVLADQCSTLMKSFFQARRTLKLHFLKTKPWWFPLLAWVPFKRLLTWLSSLVKE